MGAALTELIRHPSHIDTQNLNAAQRDRSGIEKVQIRNEYLRGVWYPAVFIQRICYQNLS